MTRSPTLRPVWEYALVCAVIYTSASALMPTNYGPKVALTTGFIFLMLATHRTNAVKSSIPGFLLLVGLLALIVFTLALSGDSDIGPYVTIPLHLLAGFWVALLLSPLRFQQIFLRVMVPVCASSLALFFVIQAVPDLVQVFPLAQSSEDYDYFNAGLHVFLVSRESGLLFDRNNGFAWEPGAYQVFLNLALLFMFDERVKSGTKKYDGWRLGVLVMGILTTFSTGGYFVLAVLVIMYAPTVFEILGARSPLARAGVGAVGAATGIFYLVARTDNTSFMGQKVAREFGNGAGGALERISLDRLQYVAMDGPGFFGMGFTRWNSFDVDIWNSVIHTAVTLGIPFAVALGMTYFFYSTSFRRPLSFLIVILVAFCTETLFWRMGFAYFAFAGVMSMWPNPRWRVIAGPFGDARSDIAPSNPRI